LLAHPQLAGEIAHHDCADALHPRAICKRGENALARTDTVPASALPAPEACRSHVETPFPGLPLPLRVHRSEWERSMDARIISSTEGYAHVKTNDWLSRSRQLDCRDD